MRRNETPPSNTEYLTIEQVADLLAVPVASVRRWRLIGEGPRFAKLGRHLRTTRGEVDAWVASRLTTSSGPLG